MFHQIMQAYVCIILLVSAARNSVVEETDWHLYTGYVT